MFNGENVNVMLEFKIMHQPYLTIPVIAFPFQREFWSEKILEKRPPTLTSIGVIFNKRGF